MFNDAKELLGFIKSEYPSNTTFVLGKGDFGDAVLTYPSERSGYAIIMSLSTEKDHPNERVSAQQIEKRNLFQLESAFSQSKFNLHIRQGKNGKWNVMTGDAPSWLKKFSDKMPVSATVKKIKKNQSQFSDYGM